MSIETAAKAYDQSQPRGGNPRETEGRALLEIARRLADAQKSPEDREGIRVVARLNWRLWTIFQAELTAPDCDLPTEIRGNMINLCNFVDRRTVDILARPMPDKLDALININRQIAAGLLTDPTRPAATSADDAQAEPEVHPSLGSLSI